MTDLRKAAEMALEALERGTTGLAIRTIPALRQALAQPEPQVCCGDYEKCMKACTPRGRWLAERELAKPEQEHQPWCDYLNIMLTSLPPQKAKCNCKQAQSEQEHESRITALEIRVAKLENPITDHEKQLMAGQRSLLRTAPPSKPWVSLTDEEIMEPWPFETRIELVRWIEAKLREKNK